jgi:hypothetical protein
MTEPTCIECGLSGGKCHDGMPHISALLPRTNTVEGKRAGVSK